MQLTKNFVLAEFNCNDGTKVPEIFISNVQKLANNLQILRDAINLPIKINSGYRTPDYNQKVGGKIHSQHLTGSAADLYVLGMSPRILKNVIERLINEKKMSNGGIGLYSSFVHYDIRGTNIRW